MRWLHCRHRLSFERALSQKDASPARTGTFGGNAIVVIANPLAHLIQKAGGLQSRCDAIARRDRRSMQPYNFTYVDLEKDISTTAR